MVLKAEILRVVKKFNRPINFQQLFFNINDAFRVNTIKKFKSCINELVVEQKIRKMDNKLSIPKFIFVPEHEFDAVRVQGINPNKKAESKPLILGALSKQQQQKFMLHTEKILIKPTEKIKKLCEFSKNLYNKTRWAYMQVWMDISKKIFSRYLGHLVIKTIHLFNILSETDNTNNFRNFSKSVMNFSKKIDNLRHLKNKLKIFKENIIHTLGSGFSDHNIFSRYKPKTDFDDILSDDLKKKFYSLGQSLQNFIQYFNENNNEKLLFKRFAAEIKENLLKNPTENFEFSPLTSEIGQNLLTDLNSFTRKFKAISMNLKNYESIHKIISNSVNNLKKLDKKSIDFINNLKIRDFINLNSIISNLNPYINLLNKWKNTKKKTKNTKQNFEILKSFIDDSLKGKLLLLENYDPRFTNELWKFSKKYIDTNNDNHRNKLMKEQESQNELYIKDNWERIFKKNRWKIKPFGKQTISNILPGNFIFSKMFQDGENLNFSQNILKQNITYDDFLKSN
ncbi:MAG: hypothetical protein ACTSWY_13850, partial [Promethearchaeota archaeon]